MIVCLLALPQHRIPVCWLAMDIDFHATFCVRSSFPFTIPNHFHKSTNLKSMKLFFQILLTAALNLTLTCTAVASTHRSLAALKPQKSIVFVKTATSDALDRTGKVISDMTKQVHLWNGDLMGAAEMYITAADIIAVTDRSISSLRSSPKNASVPTLLTQDQVRQVGVISVPEWALKWHRLLNELSGMKPRWIKYHDTRLVYRQIQAYQLGCDTLLGLVMKRLREHDQKRVKGLVKSLKEKFEKVRKEYAFVGVVDVPYQWKSI